MSRMQAEAERDGETGVVGGQFAISNYAWVERVLFGSDYPHPEGLAQPARYIEEIKHMSLDQQRKIMGGNLARLLNV
jgi:predicted TIM-barrel fold metal-dependent hydrolase